MAAAGRRLTFIVLKATVPLRSPGPR